MQGCTLFIKRNGFKSCDVRKMYGQAKTPNNLWKGWGDKGIFDWMMEGMASEVAGPKTVVIDATDLKAHRMALSLRTRMG